MSETADVVIIGGGIMGAAIALHLAKAGAGRVVLLEKRFLGAGSTGKSGAILRQHYSHEVTVRMARASLAWYAEFEERTGRNIGFRRPGMVFVVREEDRESLETNIALQRGLGVGTELLDAAALRDLEPRGVFADDHLAAWEAEAGTVDPLITVRAVADEARAKGVDVRLSEEVVALHVAGGAVREVETRAGSRIATSVVVNAGGPWARRILNGLSLDAPLTVVRPQQAWLVPPDGFGDPTAIFGDLVNGSYWKSETRGWSRAGALAYTDDDPVSNPDDYDEGVSGGFVEATRSQVARRLPAWKDAAMLGGCGALYTVTPDAHPLIGPVPGVEGLWLVAGFSGHGFKMAPAVGRGVAALIVGESPHPLVPGFFALDRAPIPVRYGYGILG